MKTNLLSTGLENNVLLTVIDATFSRRPKLENDVLLLQQLIQRHCNRQKAQLHLDII